jgi:hypothetical protein
MTENHVVESEMERMQREWEEKQTKIAHVRKTFPNVKFPNVTEYPASFMPRGSDSPVLIPNKKVIVGTIDDDQYVYGIPSDGYQIFTHEEAIHALLEQIEDLPEYGKPDWSIRFTDGGAKMRFDATFPKIKEEVKVGDIVSPMGSGWNSYDGSIRRILTLNANRLACSNGMTTAEAIASFKEKHTIGMNNGIMEFMLKDAMDRFSDQVGMWKRYNEKTLAADEWMKVFEALPFGKKQKEEILALPEVTTEQTMQEWIDGGKVNMWNGYNSLTQFITHNVESEQRRMDLEMVVARQFQRMAA